MWNVKLSGTYFTQGQHGKEISEFNFDKELPSCPQGWINSVVQKRLLPIWIEEERAKPKSGDKFKRFDGVDSCHIYDFNAIASKDSFIGKDILKMNEKEIQEVASAFVLIEVPLPRKLNIKQLRDECVLQYLKIVKKIKMETEEEKEALSFYKKNPAGYWTVDFSEQSCIIGQVIHPDDGQKVFKKIEQKSLSDILGADVPTEKELLAN